MNATLTQDAGQKGTGRGLLCINIDLDDLRYYRAIHGLPEGADTPVMFEAAVPRFLDMCDRLRVKATLFVIGMDTRWDSARDALRSAREQGHEIASHSMSHFYDLSRRPGNEVRREVIEARDRIGDAVGSVITGFRAPGYNLSRVLIESLVEAGHLYDSSVLPAPAYYLARAAVIMGMRVRGRRSASITGRAGDFFRAASPFRWPSPAPGLAEYPITACGPGRLPLIGTTLARGGLSASIPLRHCAGLELVNVEFHGLDFLDIHRDSIDDELAVEPALRVPLDQRLLRFEKALKSLCRDRDNRTLAGLADYD